MVFKEPNFEILIQKYYPLQFKEFKHHLFLYKNIVPIGKKELKLDTEEHFFYLPFEFQFGTYMKFLNRKGVMINIQLSEYISDGLEFVNVLQSYILEGFMELKINKQ